MPRYFFNTENGGHLRDVEGLELPSEHAAEVEAVRYLGELLAQAPEAYTSGALTITVTCSDGRIAFAVEASIVTGRRPCAGEDHPRPSG